MFNNFDATEDLFQSLHGNSINSLSHYFQDMQLDNSASSASVCSSPSTPGTHAQSTSAAPSYSPFTTFCPMSPQCPGHAYMPQYFGGDLTYFGVQPQQQQQQPKQQPLGQQQPYNQQQQYNQQTQYNQEQYTQQAQYQAQQQLLLMQQQQQDMATVAAASAQQQLDVINAAAARQHDEISQSLKMYAMMSAYNAAEATQQARVDNVAPNFATNRRAPNEFNQLQQIENDFNYNNTLPSATNKTETQESPTYTLSEDLRKIWSMSPAEAAVTSEASTSTGIFANIDKPMYNPKVARKYNKRQGAKSTQNKHCVFCENNKEPEAVVKSHSVRDAFGRVLCPKLRIYICPICKASGDSAHTVKYCPQKPIITMEDAIRADSLRLAKSAYANYKYQMRI